MIAKTLRRVWNGFLKIDIVKMMGREWEVVRATPATCLFLYHKDRDKVVLITQSRASVVSPKRPAGLMTEVVAGRIDKPNLTVQQIASDEAWHEAGIKIDPEKMHLLNNGEPVASSAGITDEMIYFVYGEITDENVDFTRAIFGDPKEGERINRHFFSPEEFENHVCDTMTTILFKYYFLWEREIAKNQKRKMENVNLYGGAL